MNTPLATKVRQGDCQALAQFIEEHRRQLLAFIERQLGVGLRRKLEPEDIAQEVSAEAVRSLPSVELGDRDPFSWLCQIAERKIIDAHRRFFAAKKRDAGREVGYGSGDENSRGGILNLLVASMTTPSQAFSRNAKQALMMEAIGRLPLEQREALRLRYVENLPSKEIAEKLGKSDTAIRVMLTRSLRKLQELLGVAE